MIENFMIYDSHWKIEKDVPGHTDHQWNGKQQIFQPFKFILNVHPSNPLFRIFFLYLVQSLATRITQKSLIDIGFHRTFSVAQLNLTLNYFVYLLQICLLHSGVLDEIKKQWTLWLPPSSETNVFFSNVLCFAIINIYLVVPR